MSATAIVSQVYATQLQQLFDQIARIGSKQERATSDLLRVMADATARLDSDAHLTRLTEDDFARLTRRALSSLANLPRLASSPLIKLPIIDARLLERGVGDNRLARAAELRALLIESIEQLKPRNRGEFGVGEAWRHYNVLYYPYVVGVKPYKLNDDTNHDDDTRAVGVWLQNNVPERTLHNWQNVAARLIADHLRELAANGSSTSVNGSA